MVFSQTVVPYLSRDRSFHEVFYIKIEDGILILSKVMGRETKLW